MSELLTTGQMIDRLKVGEVAEWVNIPDEFYTEERRQVKITAMGHLKYRDGERFTVYDFIMNEAKWRILPNYVSFEEAMRALKNGKRVALWNDHTNKSLKSFDKYSIIQSLEGIGLSFSDWAKGKWTIEEEAE